MYVQDTLLGFLTEQVVSFILKSWKTPKANQQVTGRNHPLTILRVIQVHNGGRRYGVHSTAKKPRRRLFTISRPPLLKLRPQRWSRPSALGRGLGNLVDKAH